jgi:xanthine dehydrogenase molybdopterin-binding subunit B
MVEVERNKSLEMTGIWGRFPFRRRVEFASTGRETQIKDRLTIKTGFLFFWYAPILSRALKSQLKQEWTYFQA